MYLDEPQSKDDSGSFSNLRNQTSHNLYFGRKFSSWNPVLEERRVLGRGALGASKPPQHSHIKCKL